MNDPKLNAAMSGAWGVQLPDGYVCQARDEDDARRNATWPRKVVRWDVREGGWVTPGSRESVRPADRLETAEEAS